MGAKRPTAVAGNPAISSNRRARSAPPIARKRTPGVAANSCAASTPRARTIAQMLGVSGALAVTHSTSLADSTLGIRFPAAQLAIAARSASHQAVPAELTLTGDAFGDFLAEQDRNVQAALRTLGVE